MTGTGEIVSPAAEDLQPAKPRNQGIDAFRYLLAYLVVLLHSLPNIGPGAGPWVFWISLICRAAVPFFFVASGYFLKPSTNLEGVLKPVRRLLPVFLFWLAIYTMYDLLSGGRSELPRPGDLLTGGRAFHLWFLPALGAGMALVGLGLGRLGYLATLALCIPIAIAGLVMGSYHDALGLGGVAGRGGLFAAPLLVFFGAAIRKTGFRPTFAFSAALAVGAYAFALGEEALLAARVGAPLVSHPFVIATFMLGPAVFLLARNLPESRVRNTLGQFGGISLTVYASHLAFLRLLSILVDRGQLWQVAAMSIAVFVLATFTAKVMRRIPFLRLVAA
jgi:surface polysaccharide O-acyltransferase-like enzyme